MLAGPSELRDWGMRDAFTSGPRQLYSDAHSHRAEELPSDRSRGFSAFAPLPNTRAAQYMAEQEATRWNTNAPASTLRSPFSQIANVHRHPRTTPATSRRQQECLYGENVSPSPAPRMRGISRDRNPTPPGDEMEYEDGERGEDRWNNEEGELVPSALRETGGGMRLEPTDVPAGGFPIIYRDDPEAGLRGMATEWIREMWSDPPNTVVLLDVFNYRYSEDDAYNRRIEAGVRSAIEFITEEADFDVVPPEPEDGVSGRGRQLPTLWAIRGLTPEGVARALARRTWSFPFITFHTSPRTTSIPRWVMMLEGFLNDNERNIRSAILRVLDEPDMRRWIGSMAAANPEFAGWPEDRAVDGILRTLRIETMQLGNGNYVTNVYIRSPTRDLHEWRLWMADLRSRRYRSFANGTGRVRYIAACGGCRSVNHPMHLCPFPRVRGWNGPMQGHGVFGERAPDGGAGANGPRETRRNAPGGRQERYERQGERERERNRASPRRDERSFRSSGPSSRGRDNRGPRSGKGPGRGPGKKGY